ncbi:LbtU family siderophore porin [Sinobacterium caligoides]|nr:LbtU family siderophore porin [Sinobacterium caligoides]
MKKTLISSAISVALLSTAVAHADDSELQAIKQRLAELEAQSAAQPASGESSWMDNVSYSGLVEVLATKNEGMGDESDSSDLSVATVELGLEAKINEWATANLVFLHEEDADESIEVDVATIVFANAELSPVSLTLGQDYLPFGSYETNLINDTLALEIGETRATTAILGFEAAGFTASGYVYTDESNEDDHSLSAYGASLGYATESFNVGADYIDNILDADTLSEFIDDNGLRPFIDKKVSGISLHAAAELGDLNLIAEHLMLDEIGDADVTASQVEAAYSFGDFTAAVAYQQTEDAYGLLPEQRLSIGGSYAVLENTTLSLEYWNDEDYSEKEGGTGDNTNNIALQVAVEF